MRRLDSHFRPALVVLLLAAAASAHAQDAPEPQDPCETDCHVSGRCTQREGRCVAASSTECQHSEDCRVDGRCTARNGACVLETSDDCARTEPCEREGRCTLAAGACVVASPADCARSTQCRDEGRCSFDTDGCRITTEAECRASSRCRHEGVCSFDPAGVCLATDDDCRASSTCRDAGRCTARAGECALATDDDCLRSTLCTELGRCTAEEHQGVMECAATTDAMCRTSEACRRSGHCSAEEGRCVPSSDAMCRRSRGCAETGACSLLRTERATGVMAGEIPAIAYCGPRNEQACTRAARCAGASCTRRQVLDVSGQGSFAPGSTRGWWCQPSPRGTGAAGVLAALGATGVTPAPRGLFDRRRTPSGGELGSGGLLIGDTIGDSFGMGGLGLRGTGRGGGGRGEGTIGLGSLGTIGRGGGGGSGAGYGRGSGGFGGRQLRRAVALGALETEGALEREVVRRVVRRHLAELRFCAESHGARHDGGTLTLRLRVERSGRVLRPAVTSRLPMGLRQCLARAAARWAFPSAAGTTRVTIPLVVPESAR